MERMQKDPSSGRFIKHVTPNRCTVEGCSRKVMGRELCNTHYLRYVRYGDVNFRHKPGNEDGAGTIRRDGYRQIYINNSLVLEHRYIVETQLGRKLKRSEFVHHIDGNKTNNDLANLIVMSASEHTKHHHRLRSKKPLED